MKLWGGRFKKKLLDDENIFNQSIFFDKKLYKEDIRGSIAHAKMLKKQNIIDTNDADLIINELNQILKDIENENLIISNEYEDIHSFIENILIERIGDAGKKLHTGRSRNDQVALDMKLFTKSDLIDTNLKLKQLLETINNLIKKHKKTYMPGFTHLRKAQPITLSHHLSAYFEMFKRDESRLSDTLNRLDECPLGAGALAGTVYPIDRDFTAKELGFKKPTNNSMDSVSDRDYLIEYIFDLSLIMMHLSRLSEEIIIWNSDDYNYITISDEYSTGSSIMPQKKNPDMAELIRGKVGRVYGTLIQLLTTLKSLPLAYNKDLQEDKEMSFDAMKTVKNCIYIMDKLLNNITWNTEVLKKACANGFINATDVADYLTKKGIPFRDAHEMVGRIILLCEEKHLSLDELPLDDYNSICNGIIENDIYDFISLQTSISNRKIKGAPGYSTL